MAECGVSNESSIGQFNHRGRQYKLFQLKAGGDYFIKIQRGGVRKQRSLKTHVLVDAKKKAKTLVDNVLLGTSSWTPAKPATNLYRIFQKYRNLASTHGLKDRSVEQNISELRKIVGRKIDPKTVSLVALNDRTIRDFFDRELASIDVRDEELRQQKLRSIRSTLKQARSVFKDAWVKRYRDAGFEVPDMSDFLKEKVEKPLDTPHVQAEDGVFEKIEAAAESIKESRPEIWVAHQLAKSTLRRGEIQRAEWTWIVHVDGQPTFRLNANQKGKRPTDIPIDPKIYKNLCEWRKKSEDDQFILPPNGWYKERCGYTCKDYDQWLRSVGLQTKKTFHEVRAWALHLIREEFGLEVAQRVGRHRDSHTTEFNYTGEKKWPVKFKISG